MSQETLTPETQTPDHAAAAQRLHQRLDPIFAPFAKVESVVCSRDLVVVNARAFKQRVTLIVTPQVALGQLDASDGVLTVDLEWEPGTSFDDDSVFQAYTQTIPDLFATLNDLRQELLAGALTLAEAKESTTLD